MYFMKVEGRKTIKRTHPFKCIMIYCFILHYIVLFVTLASTKRNIWIHIDTKVNYLLDLQVSILQNYSNVNHDHILFAHKVFLSSLNNALTIVDKEDII